MMRMRSLGWVDDGEVIGLGYKHTDIPIGHNVRNWFFQLFKTLNTTFLHPGTEFGKHFNECMSMDDVSDELSTEIQHSQNKQQKQKKIRQKIKETNRNVQTKKTENKMPPPLPINSNNNKKKN